MGGNTRMAASWAELKVVVKQEWGWSSIRVQKTKNSPFSVALCYAPSSAPSMLLKTESARSALETEAPARLSQAEL